MSDIKLFSIDGTQMTALESKAVDVEKRLQTLVEQNLEVTLGTRFLATEYSTGQKIRGRIDSLGIDENGCPVIIEYKRDLKDNVINQGLYYLDWLMDHKAEFELLVTRQFGTKVAEEIEWSNPRLLCIARDFTKYDEHAVQQMNRNIELIRYRHYPDGFLILEMSNASTVNGGTYQTNSSSGGKTVSYTTITESLERAPTALKELFDTTQQYILALGDDVQAKTLKFYFAFKRIKNFACVEVKPQKNCLAIFLKLDPGEHSEEKGFLRDVQNVGHFGTGNMEVTIKNEEDLERAKPLLVKSYEAS